MKIKIILEKVKVQELYQFRKDILRPMENDLKNVHYNGDSNDNTIHIKAMINNKIVGCLSIMKEAFPKKKYKESYRIRALAVDPQFRKKGIANLMINKILNLVPSTDFLFWGSMRVEHIQSCKNLGFYVLEDEVFNIEGTGFHVYYYGIKKD
jgi:predicted GNAT family N-acyltransferase